MKTEFRKILNNNGKGSLTFLGAFFLALVLLNPGWGGKALASEAITVSGDFSVTEECTVPDIDVNGKNVFVDLKEILTYTGGLDGKVTSNGTIIVHPNGTANLLSRATFCGTVYDNDGTCKGRGSFAIDSNLRIDFSASTVSGPFVGHNGTEGLSGLHLVGSINGILGVKDTYEAVVHFDPQVDSGCDAPVPECEVSCDF